MTPLAGDEGFASDRRTRCHANCLYLNYYVLGILIFKNSTTAASNRVA